MKNRIVRFVLAVIALNPFIIEAQEDVLYGVNMLGELYSIDPEGTGTYIGTKERPQLLAQYLPLHSLAYVGGYFYGTFGTYGNRMVRFGFYGGDEQEIEQFQELGIENVFSMERKDSDEVYLGFSVEPSDLKSSNEIGVLNLSSMSLSPSTEIDSPHSDCIQAIAYDDALLAFDWNCSLGSGNVWNASSDIFLLDNASLITGSYGPQDGSGNSVYELAGVSRNLAANSASELYFVGIASPSLYEITRNGASPYLTYSPVGSVMDDSSCSGSLSYFTSDWACEFSGLSFGGTPPTRVCDQLDTAYIQDSNELGTAYVTREGLIAAGDKVVPGYYESQGIVQIQDTANVTYTSGTKIILTDGFYAWEGSEFLARIDYNYCS